MSSQDETAPVTRVPDGDPAALDAAPPGAPVISYPEQPSWGFSLRNVETWVGLVLGMLLFLVMKVTLPASLPVYEVTSVGVPFASAATPGSTVELSVSPRTEVTGEVTAQSFIACPGVGLHPWQPPPSIQINKKGFVFLRGTMENVLEPGSCQIWIVIARPGKAPGDFSSRLLAGDAGPYQMAQRKGHSDWEAVSATIEVRPRG